MSDPTQKTGWELLHSKLPPSALKPISRDVYGVEGLTDVNEGYLINRLHLSGLAWSWDEMDHQYLGAETRRTRGNNPYDYTVYLASVRGVLSIETGVGSGKFLRFSGSGAHDNRKLDAAFKGADTVAFKNACKKAGLFNQLLMDGKSIDFFYTTRDGEVAPGQGASDPPDHGAEPKPQSDSSTSGTSSVPTSAPSPEPTAASTPSNAGSSTPKVELTQHQAAAVKWLLEKMPEGEARDKAKQATWAKMQAAAVRDPKLAFRVGITELFEHSTIAHGPDNQFIKIVRDKLDTLDPQQPAAAA